MIAKKHLTWGQALSVSERQDSPNWFNKRGENMRMRKRIPTHPGGILKRQYIEPLSLEEIAVCNRDVLMKMFIRV